MNKLPFLISVPHAGTKIPNEVKSICNLNYNDIIKDSDEGAGIIYDLKDDVEFLIKGEVARAIVDLNRSPDDFSDDGVIKNHTCQMKPVYITELTLQSKNLLLKKYYLPFHREISEKISINKVKYLIGFDCHTMLQYSPSFSEEPGKKRPWVCLSNGNGKTCQDIWIRRLAKSFGDVIGEENVKINDPFKGGYISMLHSKKLPWIQIEVSREPFATNEQKKHYVRESLLSWYKEVTETENQ